jgi:hypothetical protein
LSFLLAITAYAWRRNDTELEVWFAEIRLRASIKIGELVGDLETALPGCAGGGSIVQASGRSKTEALEAAGLTRVDAYECQQLAGGKKQAVARLAHRAVDAHFARKPERRAVLPYW